MPTLTEPCPYNWYQIGIKDWVWEGSRQDAEQLQ
jgi:hypothetical protein